MTAASKDSSSIKKDDANSGGSGSGSGINIPHSHINAATNAAATTNNRNNAPGDLLGYFINRRRGAVTVSAPIANNSSSGNNGASDTTMGDKGEKSSSTSRSARMRYHEMVNAGGSFYFGSMGALSDDSDSDDDTTPIRASRGNVVTSPPTATATVFGGAENNNEVTVNTSWLASFQRNAKKNAVNLPPAPAQESTHANADESSSSWMSQALQTVGDSARELMLLPNNKNDQHQSSDNSINNNGDAQSNWMIPSTLSNAVSNTFTTISSFNPFSDDTSLPNDLNTNVASTSQSNNNNNNASSSEFLPKFASKFEWATKQRNPYQAVIGRGDADYLLSSPGTYYNWNVFSLTSWLSPWITNHRNNKQLLENEMRSDKGADSDGGGRRESMLLQQALGRKKSQPSEASVQAVKNLLLLVQHQIVVLEQRESENEDGGHQMQESSEDELHSIMSEQHQSVAPRQNLPSASPPHSPKPMAMPASPVLPSLLSTPNPEQLLNTIPMTPSNDMTPFPDLKEDNTKSFDSEPSYDPTIQSSPVRGASPIPGVHHHSHSPIGKSSPVPFSPVSLRPARESLASNDHENGSSSNMDSHQHNNASNNGLIPSANQAMHAEMAARLAEGTLRAYRDLALDEATELHSALHHWTIRWERPFLGWLEAGPNVWFSERGYSPQLPGKKVSQIQAVLARRCAVIGELQQHLWRANWQKGVAEWGMLGGGIGGEWTSVVGELGGMEAPSSSGSSCVSSSSTSQQKTRPQKQKLMKIFNHSSFVGTNVSNSPGGSIVVDQDALTTWSIDAMRVIRDQLYRALPSSQGVRELPFVEHWPHEKRHFRGAEASGDDDDDDVSTTSDLPLWAQEMSPPSNNTKLSDASRAAAEAVNCVGKDNSSSVIISDLHKMSNEVSSLLQSIELHLEQQRVRRLNRLRPPSRLRRNWYLVAVGVPVGAYVLYKLTKEHGGFFILKTCISKVADIYRDHVSEPLNAIYQELFTSGRIDVTDRKARVDAIASLKRMIRSWLDESFAEMPLEEKIVMAETMDISLIEEKMEESIKHIYELNSVVRMSLIEMQFMRKELLSALVAMDELMGSNEMNMQLAAMTPAVILLVTIRRGFRLLFYAFFQVGKSKEEIYSSFRQTILDIERLLVMRDNPPLPPDSLEWGSSRVAESLNNKKGQNAQTLSVEDLGMLLLHIHECRNILWQSRRRFRSDVLRNVSEDLAELAGERGSVSVTQQLQIISRMSRTYPFMKVVSSGVPFDMIIPGAE